MPLPEPAPPPAKSTLVLPEKVRIHLADGTTVKMEYPRVDGDSLRGLMPGAHGDLRNDRRVAFALKDVQAIEGRRVSAGKTVAFVLGTLVVTGGVVLLIVAISLAGSN